MLQDGSNVVDTAYTASTAYTDLGTADTEMVDTLIAAQTKQADMLTLGTGFLLNVQTACSAGYYQPLWGASASSDCLIVPAGHYTEIEASTEYYDNKCKSGFFCLA